MRSARTGMCLREQDHWQGEGGIPRPRSTAGVPLATIPHPTAGSPATWRSTPLQVSEKLLQRHRFRPAVGVNVLAAAWPAFYRRTNAPDYHKPEDWWLGPALLQTLFALEHKAIGEALRRDRSRAGSATLRRLAETTCMALIGKVHLQWREAMAPTRYPRLRDLWRQLMCRCNENSFDPVPLLQVISPLLPDRFEARSAITGAVTGPSSGYAFHDVRMRHNNELMDRIGINNLWYSFGTGVAGAFAPNNCPTSQRRLPDPGNNRFLDLVAARIAQQRACGAGDFNQLRQSLGLSVLSRWQDFDPRWSDQLCKHYASPQQLDSWVGMLAEARDPAANFGETALACLLAFDQPAVRLPSDDVARHWVRNNDLRSVLLRHYPVLQDGLYRLDNPFARWREISLIVPLQPLEPS